MNRKRRTIILFFIITGSLPGLAQGFPGGGDQFKQGVEILSEPEVTFTFELNAYSISDLEEQLAETETGLFRNHPLENEVARRLELFEETYTYYSPAAPGSFSDSKVIRKPVIYNSVYRIDKHYRRQVRSGEAEKEQAIAQMSNLLYKALLIFPHETGELEEALSKAPSAPKMVSLFNQVELLH